MKKATCSACNYDNPLPSKIIRAPPRKKGREVKNTSIYQQ